MGMATLEEIANEAIVLREKGYNKVTPHFIHKILNNMAAGHISIKYGLKVRTYISGYVSNKWLTY